MAMLDAEIIECLDRLRLGFVATVSSDHTPNVSPKGTIIAWGSDSLVFADIRSPQTVKNLEANPAVEINVVDPVLRKGFRFRGTAEILRGGGEYARIISHYRKNGIRSRIAAIVRVRLSSVKRVTSPLYDLGMSEEQIRDRWKGVYSGKDTHGLD